MQPLDTRKKESTPEADSRVIERVRPAYQPGIPKQKFLISILFDRHQKDGVWPGIEPGTSRILSHRVNPKRESYR